MLIEKGQDLILKVLNEQGELTKVVQFKQTLDWAGFVHCGKEFVSSDNRLLLTGRDLAMFDLEELLSTERNNNVSLKTFPELRQKNCKWLMEHTSLSTITFEKEEQMKPKIKVTKANFWAMD